MPETAPETAPADVETVEESATPETPNPEQQELDLGDPGKKAIAAEREARKAAEKRAAELDETLQQLQARVKEFEDRDKTDDQKRQEAEQRRQEEFQAAKAEAETARDEAQAAYQELARYQVGVEKGLSPTLIGRLQGTTPEELSADADRLIEEIGAQAKPRKPLPDPTLGRGGSAGTSTADQFAAALNSLL